MPSGKYRYVYAKSYKEVKEKKKLLETQKDQKNADKVVSALKAWQLFENWLTGDLKHRVKSSTYESYYRCVQKYIIPFFRRSGSEQITEIQAAQFSEAICSCADLSDAYKRKILSIFKTALREILKGEDVSETVLQAVRLPRGAAPTVQVFSVKEQREIEKTILDINDPLALGILLCFYTGIRLGEICALTWQDIDFEAGTMAVTKTVSRIKNFDGGSSKTLLHIDAPKSLKSVRKIPVPEFLIKLSQDLKNGGHTEKDYLLSGTEVPIDPRTYQKLFKKILNQAGVRDRKFHAIRHTFATRALELGVDIKTLSEILGHANVSITLNIYTHSLFEQKKRAIDKLNEMYIMHTKTAVFAVRNTVITA